MLATLFATRRSLFALLGGDAGTDLAAHAGATEAAIAVRILRQILLMIILGEIERRRIADFRSDRPHSFGRKRLGIAFARRFGSGALRRRKHVDTGTVLGADVIALPHALRRVVTFPKSFEQLFVGDFLRVVDDQHDFVMTGAPAAHLVIGGIGR